MLTVFRFTNVVLILAMIVCAAGALAGLILLLPFVAGAWALNLMALVGFEQAARSKPVSAKGSTRGIETISPSSRTGWSSSEAA